MLFTTIVRDYFHWHYTKAWSEVFHVWLTFLWWVITFFSLPTLARSLFSPWKRITEEKKREFSFENIAGYIIINGLSRFLGFLFRSIIISIGLVVLSIIVCLGALTHLFWAVAPVLLVLCFGLGATLIVTYFFI
jgi:hypothetical protein